MSQELKLNALYQHYKTRGIYMPLALVKNTGDGRDDEMMVLYYSFSARALFTRPLAEFVARVHTPEDQHRLLVPRFALIENPGDVR